MQLAPGTVVDRYRVEAELGRGGMARVYRVRHVTLDTVFALKVLVLGGEDLRQRLVREGRVQARLDHPNLVAVRDVLVLPDGPALLMDYVDGPSMDRWLTAESPEEATRARVVEGILDGVGFAHAQGVVHRDLKPANVLMERSDGVWHPRVADFGLAKIVGGEEGDVLQTRTGRPMGTPSYMAPEQVRSAKHVDARADVFALGCILYELWCDRRAFVGEDSLEVFNRVTKGRFLPPRSLRADVPTPVEAAVLGALEVDPAARIPDVATFRRVLRGEQAWSVRVPAPADATLAGDGLDEDVVATRSTPPSGRTWVPEVTGEPSVTLAPATTSAPASSRPASEAPPPGGPSSRRGAGARLLLVAAVMVGGGLLLRSSPRDAAVATPVVATPPLPEDAAPPPVVEAVPPVAEPAVALDPPAPPVVTKAVPVAPRAGAMTGRVVFAGDALEVRLAASDGALLAAGEVPAGDYVVQARFDGGGFVHGANLRVTNGATLRVDCRAATLTCDVR